MDLINGILTNRTITIPAFAWFLAQLIKVFNVIIVERKLDFTKFVSSGGMPSSHSAFIVSLSAVVGKNRGVESVEFGMAMAIALIVMYDAAGIRRAAGKQAKVLNQLIFSTYNKAHFDEKLKELLGHSPFEVFMGALLGIVIGLGLG